MLDQITIVIIVVFILAGLIKGVIGLGLPTISMGLLAVVMAPAQAAAMLIVPSLVTNVWQALDGPHLRNCVKRLWPMLLGVCLGTWAGAGWLTGPYARTGAIALGLALILYAIVGLSSVRVDIPERHRHWTGIITGILTGLLTAATGVFVLPAIVYLQGIGMEKDELVQALGLSFTVSTIALSFNLVAGGVFTTSMTLGVVVGLVAAMAGMWLGQMVRRRIDQQTFRRWFFISLLVLGVYLSAGPLLRGIS